MRHCLNKRERPLHSEVTSKSKDQSTSFAKYPALIMAGYFVLYKISLPGSIGLISFKFGSFLKHFGILIAKISGSAGRQTTHDFKRLKIKTNFKKVKRKWQKRKKKELRTIRLWFRKEQSLMKNRLNIKDTVIEYSPFLQAMSILEF